MLRYSSILPPNIHPAWQEVERWYRHLSRPPRQAIALSHPTQLGYCDGRSVVFACGRVGNYSKRLLFVPWPPCQVSCGGRGEQSILYSRPAPRRNRDLGWDSRLNC